MARRRSILIGAHPIDYSGHSFPMSQERSARTPEEASKPTTAWKRLEAELHAQKELFANQLAIARAASEHPALEKTLQNILDVMISLTDADGATLFLFDQAGGLAGRLVTQSPLPPQQPTQATRLLQDGLVGWVARHRQPALVHDTASDERWLTLEIQRQETRSALCVPILMGDVLLGVLTLIHSSPQHFGDAQLHFIQAAGDQMALALRNAQVFDAMSRLAERQRTLYEVLRAAGGVLDPDAALETAVEAITRHTGWSHVDVVIRSPDAKRWQVRASTAGRPRGAQAPIEAGVLGRAYCSGKTQLVPDVGADPDYLPGSPSVRSELAVPLRRGDRILGVLNVESELPDAFRPEDVQLTESLADAVSLALDNASLYQAVAADGERLRSLIAEERRLEKLREDLSHMMIHDLRSPVSSIQGALEVLSGSAARTLDPADRLMFDTAWNATQKLRALVDAILDLSRLEQGALPLSRQQVAVPTLVTETLQLYAPQTRERGLSLASDVPPDLPPLRADADLVGRVLQNLVGNAVKFVPRGGAVSVVARMEEGDPETVRITVSDTGTAIPAGLQARLFQKFAAGDQRERGSGLGLAFCKLAVEAHGGRIWLDTGRGQGVAFAFTLPVSASNRTDPAA